MEHIYKSVFVYVPVISCGMMDPEFYKSAFGAIEINRVTKNGGSIKPIPIFSVSHSRKSHCKNCRHYWKLLNFVEN